MRGHIVKRSKDSWTVVLSLGRDPATGKRKQQWVSVKGTKKQAEQKLAELLHQVDTGGFVKPAKLTVAEFLRQWLQDYASTNVRPTTLDGYRNIIERHLVPALGYMPLSNLQPQHLQAYYAEALDHGRKDSRAGSGLSATSVRGRHRILSEALSHAVRWGLIIRNVAQAVDPPRPERKEMQSLDSDGVNAFLEAAQDTPHHVLFYLAVDTGLRCSELLALRWKDIDTELLTLSVIQVLHQLRDGRIIFHEPKTAKGRRQVALTPSSAIVLREHGEEQAAIWAALGKPLSREDLVFSHHDGRPLHPNVVSPCFP